MRVQEKISIRCAKGERPVWRFLVDGHPYGRCDRSIESDGDRLLIAPVFQIPDNEHAIIRLRCKQNQ